MPKYSKKLIPGKLYRTVGTIFFEQLGITRNIIVMLLSVKEETSTIKVKDALSVDLLINGKIVTRNFSFAYWFKELE